MTEPPNRVAYAAFWRRVRQITFAAFVATIAAACLAMWRAAVTAEEPLPIAEVRAGIPIGPEAIYYCIEGRVEIVYITSRGERLEPVPTEPERAC